MPLTISPRPAMQPPRFKLELELTGPELIALMAAAVSGTNAVANPPPSQVSACAKLLAAWDGMPQGKNREGLAKAIDWHSYAMETSWRTRGIG